MVGEWSAEEARRGHAPRHDQRTGLTSGGSALVETLFPGSDHEMLSVYHMDGDALVMTHYCMLQNAPQMRAQASSDPDTIAFECEGGASIEDCREPHMHEGKFELVDRDTVLSAWTMYDQGEPVEEKTFTLRRK